MKKILFALTALALISTAAYAVTFNYGAAQKRLNKASNPMIVMPGDSNLVRWYKALPPNPVPGFTIVPWGENGINSAEMLTGLNKIVWNKTPTHCIYLGPTNDTGWDGSTPDQTPAQTKANVKAIAVLLKAHCSEVTLFSILPNFRGVNMDLWQDAVQQAASEEAVNYVDLRPLFVSTDFENDGIHLDNPGVPIFTQAIIDATN